jgi:aminopeptidase
MRRPAAGRGRAGAAQSSPIAQSGRLFYNTLFDENAASHVALGTAYKFTLSGADAMSDDEFRAAGGNRSAVHVDFMIRLIRSRRRWRLANGQAEP